MSLINDMLRNLEARHGDSPHLPPGLVHGGGQPQRATVLHIKPWWLVVAAALLMVVIITWLPLHSRDTNTVPATDEGTTQVIVELLTPPPTVMPPATLAEGPPPTAKTGGDNATATIVAPSTSPIAPPPSVAPTTTTIERTPRPPTAEELAEQEYKRGFIALNTGNFLPAEQAFRAALRNAPTHFLAREALAALLLGRGRTVEARELLEQGSSDYAQHPVLVLLLARAHLEQGQLNEAVNVLEQYRRAANERADYLAFLAALYQRQQRYTDSMEVYQDALRLQPEQSAWWAGLGIALEHLDRPVEAYRAYQRASNGALEPRLMNYVRTRMQSLAQQSPPPSDQQ